jgi:hypothetical protein
MVKVAHGVALMGSAVAMAFGHGLVGHALKQAHLKQLGTRLAGLEAAKANKIMREGFKDLGWM